MKTGPCLGINSTERKLQLGINLVKQTFEKILKIFCVLQTFVLFENWQTKENGGKI